MAFRDYKNEINYLNQDELSYELTIRGLPTGKVDDMRSDLRTILKAEKQGESSFVEPYPYKFEEDLDALSKKIEEIKEHLDAFKSKPNPSKFKKIRVKIDYALNRVDRCQPIDGAQASAKNTVKAKLVLALGSLQTDVSGSESEEDDGSESEEDCTLGSSKSRSRCRVPIYKWDLKFTGEHGQSLNSFLERVLELSEARGVSKSILFRSALDLFSGRALIWYRANKNKFHKWSDLVEELRKEFLPPDYDDRLLDEIRRRTQGKEESIGSYVAVLTTMFSRLSSPLSESERLKVIKRNISPFYQTQMGLMEVKTVQELVDMGRRLEAVRHSVEAFIPPPSRRSNQLLEPDLAYVSTERVTVSAIQNSGPKLKCFRCGRGGHLARHCRQNIRCYGCGMPGVTIRGCERCNSGSSGTGSNEGSKHVNQSQGNGSGARQ